MPRILIIDDQPTVRAALLAALKAKGFEALGYGDGASALREFDAAPFDLAVVDIYIPGFDGIKIIKALRERSPRLPIIAISGVLFPTSDRSPLDFLSKSPALANIVCLQKPFRPADLVEAIRKAMAVAA